MDVVDDEAPPMLVAAGDAVDGEVPDLVDTAVADLNLTKVPITIVTGRSNSTKQGGPVNEALISVALMEH